MLFFSMLKRLLSSPTITLGKDVLLPSMALVSASGVLGAKESSSRPDTSLAGVAVDRSSLSGVLVDAKDVERWKTWLKNIKRARGYYPRAVAMGCDGGGRQGRNGMSSRE